MAPVAHGWCISSRRPGTSGAAGHDSVRRRRPYQISFPTGRGRRLRAPPVAARAREPAAPVRDFDADVAPSLAAVARCEPDFALPRVFLLARSDDRAPAAGARAPVADAREPVADAREPVADARAPAADARERGVGSPSPGTRVSV